MNLRQYARGKPCQMRIPGVCNHNPETTVLCHLGGGGMGTKQPDILGAWGCSDCHDVVDGRRPLPKDSIPYQEFYERAYILACHSDGVKRTQQELLKTGLGEVIEQWAKTLPKNQ